MAKFEQGMLILYSPLGHHKLTVSSAAVSLPSLPDLSRLRRAVIRTRNQPIVWRDDGVDPDATTGMWLASQEVLVYDGSFEDLRLIMAADATGAADVRVAYYGL